MIIGSFVWRNKHNFYFFKFSIFVEFQLFYSMNSIINLTKLVFTVGKVIDEHIYATASTVFHVIEIGSIVLVADAMSKEVSCKIQVCE